MSHYTNVAEKDWATVTQGLVQAHPLDPQVILETALRAWGKLWMTKVGGENGLPLRELAPPATVIGHFFEKLFTFELAKASPLLWVGGKGSQKDLHCLTDENHAVEIKTSGQLAYKIYGNRSYGQEAGEGVQKKNKSGYYITVNFYEDKITLIRFGWIDAADWKAQKSQTGQAATLSDSVYAGKLIEIRGPYMLDAPVGILPKVGDKAVADLNSAGIVTIRQLVAAGDAMIPQGYHKLAARTRQAFADVFPSK